MVFWAGNFIVVKGAVEILPPVGFSFLRFASRLDDPAGPAALARGRASGSAARRRRADRWLARASSGSACYQILWPIALQTHPGRRLGAAHRDDAGHDRAAGDGDRRRHAERGRSSSARSSRSPAWRWSSRAGQGLDLGGVARRRRPDAGRGRLLGDLHACSAARSCAATPRCVTTTWAIVAGTVFLAPLGHRPARDRRHSSGDRPGRSCSRSSTRGRSRPGFANVIVFHGVEAARTDPGHGPPVPGPGAGGRRWRPSSSASRSARSRSSAASIILAGVALTCDAARGRAVGRAARAIGGMAR